MAINNINNFKTIEEVESYRKKINEACDKRAEKINLCLEAEKLSHKPFAYIKEAFEALSSKLYNSKKGLSLSQKYISTIKGSKNLSAFHSICENIRKVGQNSDVDFFINNLADKKWGVDKKTAQEDCLRLGRVLAEAYIFVGKEAKGLMPEENVKLNNAVQFIAENKKTAKNLADYSNAVKIIRENIAKNSNESNIFENKDIDDMANSMLKEYREKYANAMTEEELSLLDEIRMAENREDFFNDRKSICLEVLKKAKEQYIQENNTSTIERLNTIMEQVSGKYFNADTFGDDIYGFNELTKVFK